MLNQQILWKQIYLISFFHITGTNDALGMQEFNAKLSDFGLAKAGPTGDRTHVSTQVMGTHGYAAPEYVATGLSDALMLITIAAYLATLYYTLYIEKKLSK